MLSIINFFAYVIVRRSTVWYHSLRNTWCPTTHPNKVYMVLPQAFEHPRSMAWRRRWVSITVILDCCVETLSAACACQPIFQFFIFPLLVVIEPCLWLWLIDQESQACLYKWNRKLMQVPNEDVQVRQKISHEHLSMNVIPKCNSTVRFLTTLIQVRLWSFPICMNFGKTPSFCTFL